MKDNKKFKISIPAVVCAAVLITFVAAVYTVSLNKTVSANINDTISELAEHDQRSIQNYIEENWEELEYLEGKFASYDCESLTEIETLMNVEAAQSKFSHIYMVGEDGIVYTDKMLSYDPSKDDQSGRVNLLPYFESGDKRIAARYDDKLLSVGIARENILYGISLDDFSVDGKKMVGLAGICDLDAIQDKLVINSFTNDEKSRGYSAVIDEDGNYIVNEDDNVFLDNTNNFFLRIDNAESSQFKGSVVRSKMNNGETFSFSVTTGDGVKKIVYCMPFSGGNLSWYFLLSVEKAVFTEQNRTLLAMSMLMLVSIVMVIVILLTYVMSSQKEIMTANAEAKARSQFLANMSHEIRTPLNGIIGLTYLIEKDVENPDTGQAVKSVKLRISKMKSTSKYLLSLINNILDISKLQSGKLNPNKDVISPEIITDAVYSMQKSGIESNGIEFTTEKNIFVPWILGDDILIKRVLMNIVGNAAKFTDPGGKITLSVSQREEDDNRVATYFVCTDNGCGMSEDFLEHIWDLFSQAQKSSGGTGLGMPISRLLVNAMGGEISVESKLGHGSRVTVVFHSEIAERPPQFVHFDVNGEAPEPKDLKILIAEDNELNAEILVDILENEGYEVVHAENGKTASEIFADSKIGEFDVILMDMQMPIMDGCTATEKIRAMDRPDAETVKIFACTANSFKDDRNRAVASGMNDFLSKPVDVNELISKLGGNII